MLPGFTKREDIVGVMVNFEPMQLERDPEINPGDSDRPGRYSISESCHDAVKDCLESYYSEKPELTEYSWGAMISFRVYEEDVNTLCALLANEIVISITTGNFFEEEVTEYSYRELLEGTNYDFDENESSFDDISDVRVDIEAEIEAAIPDGFTEADFSTDRYFDFLREYVTPIVNQSDWKGAHAWLMNLGFMELRNGRYESAGYCFEGARIGLTKHSIFPDTIPRLSAIVDRSLVTLRELCLHQAGVSENLRGIELICELKNRDLIYVPEFTQTPLLHDRYFRFRNEIWIANSLILVQAVAHAMEQPTISRSEVDPFGTDLTVKNWSFLPKAVNALYELRREAPTNEDTALAHLEAIDFEDFAPEITLTRILSESGFSIKTYSGTSIGSEDNRIEIDYDFIVQREGLYHIVRALRSEDQSIENVERIIETVDAADVDHMLMLVFQSEVSDEMIDYFNEKERVEAYYVDLNDEQISPVNSGFPRSFEDLTTNQEITERLSELYEAAENAETNEEKGDSLEELMRLIFGKVVPDTRVRGAKVRTRVEEIDLQLTSRQRRYPWIELGSPINVECKNWSEAAGVDVIYTAYGKARATSPDCKGIILVCWEGVTDEFEGRYGDQAIREIRGKGIQILTLDKSDLLHIADTGDAQSVFEDKADELWNR